MGVVQILFNDWRNQAITLTIPFVECNGDVTPVGLQRLTSKSVWPVEPGTENRHEEGRKARGGREIQAARWAE